MGRGAAGSEGKPATGIDTYRKVRASLPETALVAHNPAG